MGSFTNLSLTNKVTKLTIVNRLSVRNSNLKSLTTFSNSKMVCNKITFVFVLVGLISISSMVSSAAVGADPTTVATTLETTTLKTTTLKTTTDDKETTQKPDPTNTATTQKADPTDTATTQKADPTNTATTKKVDPTNGAGCPKITYGMLFSVISAILFLSA